jgi:RHS repeat-associated protein
MTSQNAAELISVPKAGGAIPGIGGTFQPDLHTGTGNLTIPLELPAGRNGLTPSLTLSYSTGNPSGPFGLGWALPVPEVRRKTDQGIPRYDPALDTFILSGAEDLVPVSGIGSETVRYRPRGEAGYARITHVTGTGGDYWEVWSADGLRSRYGTPLPPSPPPGWADPAVITDPAGPERIFAWLISETVDPLGNRISYAYRPDDAGTAQRYLSEISYGDYGDKASPQYLATVKIILDPVPRPDPFSDCRPGFELRTTQRAAAVETWTHTSTPAMARRVELSYADQDGVPPASTVSLLTRVTVAGADGDNSQVMPPLEFGYTPWDPATRSYQPLGVTAGQLPATSLAEPGLDLVDMFGDGLVSILELNGTARYWRNRGGGRFDPPRNLSYAPAGIELGEPGVQLADLDGDGRPELLVSSPVRAGYWPLTADGGFDPSRFVALSDAPTVSLSDPLVRLIDLDGDGITDALRTGDCFELFYSDLGASFHRVQVLERDAGVPDVTFGDPRVFLADMTGDGLTDIALVHDGNISYWPYQGYGTWGAKVIMRNPPSFPDAASYAGTGFDPRRLLLGDVDGDGCADIVYLADDAVTVWINQAGNGFADPVTVRGTPQAAGASLRLADMYGTGTAGVLWTYDLGSVRGSAYKFLSLTGGTKPYLLNQVDNHAGAITAAAYASSTAYAAADLAAGNPWQTTLPFPVQVVASTTVTDYFSGTTLTSEYLYHHGYWDGDDREFRGFARVDQRDTLATPELPFYSPPTETRTWFHLGPVGPESGAWTDGLDLCDEYWQGDLPLSEQVDTSALPLGMNRRGLRYAVRALRGLVLRSELYALDGDSNAGRPYQITDHAYALDPILDGRPVTNPGWQAQPVAAARPVLDRTSVWERGSDPMTQATFTGGYDDYGRPAHAVQVAVPRGRDPRVSSPAYVSPYLATATLTRYATRDDASRYLINRVSLSQRLELNEDTAAAGGALVTFGRQQLAAPAAPTAGTVRELTLTYYDGPPFEGLPTGQLGDWGLVTRLERLALTPGILAAAYQDGDASVPLPPYLRPADPAWTAEYPRAFRQLTAPLAGYRYQPELAPHLAGWYAQQQRLAYDIQQVPDGRGLVTVRRDPLGNDTAIGYDSYQLLPASVTDAAGLIRRAAYDYRVLRPSLITDPNGNRTAIGYTPLGLPAWTASTGKPGARQGDTPQQPGAIFTYDLTAWDDSGPADRQPTSVHTTRRVAHRWTLIDAANARRAQLGLPPLTTAQIAAMFPPDEAARHPGRFLQKTEYTDGFGRRLQTRAQADDIILDDLGLTAELTAPGPVATHRQDPAAPPQVAVSGWQTYDNKGRIVQKYEPSFDTGWAFRPPAGGPLNGQPARVIIRYDPRGLAILTIFPDGSQQRLVPGIPADLTDPDAYQPTPWESYSYDNDDNAGRTSPAASAGWSSQWNTPSSDLVDPLGRVVRHTERTTTAVLATHSTLDIDGNLLQVTDALGRVAVQQVYDLLGRSWQQQVIDAGTVRVVLDSGGSTLERRDARQALTLAAFDALRRPCRSWARDRAADLPTLRQAVIYGDDRAESGLTPARAAAANLLGRPYQTYDEAGRTGASSYDLDGNLLEKTRRTLAASVLVSALPGPAGDWANAAYQADWQPAAGQSLGQHADPLLDLTAYTTTTTYDALARPVTVTAPLDADGNRKILQYAYGRAGALTALTVDHDNYIRQILYNARGQRVLVVLGCATVTRYVYDPQTFRLARLRSEPALAAPSAAQDYGYAYDLVGNLLLLRDRTPGSGISPTPSRLNRAFTYDPLYQLTSATGRECDIPLPAPWSGAPRCADRTKVRAYTETYTYDEVGGLLKLAHHAATGGFARTFEIAPGGNQAVTMTTGSTAYRYTFDNCGNMTSETTSRLFEWNHANQLATFRNQTPRAEPSLYAEYRYDAAGQRVLKMVRKRRGQLAVTIYIDGLFERLTLTSASTTTSHDTLHVLDGVTRVAAVRAGPPLPGDASPPVAYHLGDHLGSSTVVLDGSGAFVNREEYTPYGETSFGSYARKRYRFTAKERDEESGLYYHGARYYAPWLTRWASADPLPKPAWSPYRYGGGNPLRMADPSGAQETEAPLVSEQAPTVSGTAAEAATLAQPEPADDAAEGTVETQSDAAEMPESVLPKPSGKAERKTTRSPASGTEPGKTQTKSEVSAKLGPLFESAPPDLWTEHMDLYSRGALSTWIDLKAGSAKVEVLAAEVGTHGVELSMLDIDITSFKAEAGALWGDWLAGMTGNASLTAGQFVAKLGLKEGSLAAEIGGSLATLHLETGGNLFGVNVSGYGEVNAGLKWGFSAGEMESVSLGVVGFGVATSAAKSPDARAGWLNFLEDTGNASSNYLTNPIFGNGSPYFW